VVFPTEEIAVRRIHDAAHRYSKEARCPLLEHVQMENGE
jgi:hypothetical protein